MLAERVDVELDRAAIGAADFLLSEIHRERRVSAAVGIIEEFGEILRRYRDRQNAVLETVVVENVGERGRDHAADAEIEERPRRVLARGAAAEIVAGHQNLGLAVGRLVEDETRILAAVVLVAKLREQGLAEAGALDRLQILLRDDLVGIGIYELAGWGDALKHGKFFHGPGSKVGFLPGFLAGYAAPSKARRRALCERGAGFNDQ